MRRSLLVAVQALACLVMPRPANTAFSRCLVLAGTTDALGKSNAVDESQKSLRAAIDKWKADNGITGPVSETAEKPQPRAGARSIRACSSHPTWSPTASYTLCWKGIVSPVVCTTGARICW